jgi:plasmid stabilization system protein ParE
MIADDQASQAHVAGLADVVRERDSGSAVLGWLRGTDGRTERSQIGLTYGVKIHDGAKADLRRIGRWIAEYSGREVAERKLNGIWKTIFALRELPHRGNLQPDLGADIRAVPSGDKAVVVFHVDEAALRVTVLVVSYVGQDWGRPAKGRVK